MNHIAAALETRYDRFGNPIDITVGYARGNILATSLDDAKRMAHAWDRTQTIIRAKGPDSFAILTGNAGNFPVHSGETALCNEWIAPGVAAGKLQALALEHLGGGSEHGFVLYSRTAAVIVAWIMLHGRSGPVLSVVPEGGHGHSSIHFGAAASGSRVIEVTPANLTPEFLHQHQPECAIITSVTSSMEELSDSEIQTVASTLRDAGCLTLLDDAYGARIRPIFHGQQRSLQTGVDVAVTNGDKVGLGGPRCALVGGAPSLVAELSVWAAESGTDARGPMIVAMLRALESFTSDQLLQDAQDGRTLGAELIALLGEKYVQPGTLGPKITEEDAMELVLDRCGGSNPHRISPSEVTAAVGLHVLGRGIVTVNSHGQPGARVSLRLKPTAGCLEAAGGAGALAKAFDDAFSWVAENLHRPQALEAMILG
ncbi:hypothetical protein [Paenarthrobacter aromaticivorans]|uniref:hypothetical protein n=1 Tax=Paenarthrobacter aromaticivorans TaxID=2849150 RepID=UPI003A7F8AA7